MKLHTPHTEEYISILTEAIRYIEYLYYYERKFGWWYEYGDTFVSKEEAQAIYDDLCRNIYDEPLFTKFKEEINCLGWSNKEELNLMLDRQLQIFKPFFIRYNKMAAFIRKTDKEDRKRNIEAMKVNFGEELANKINRDIKPQPIQSHINLINEFMCELRDLARGKVNFKIVDSEERSGMPTKDITEEKSNECFAQLMAKGYITGTEKEFLKFLKTGASSGLRWIKTNRKNRNLAKKTMIEFFILLGFDWYSQKEIKDLSEKNFNEKINTASFPTKDNKDKKSEHYKELQSIMDMIKE